jgi:putative ABC transport system ATP-binding protein
MAVFGQSGAGKTLLLRAIALLDPLDSGEIHYRGEVVRGQSVPPYRQRVIYIHQRPALFDGNVEDNLRQPFSLKAHKGRMFDRHRCIELLSRLGRDEAFLGKSTHNLSGGEGQIVALIRAIQLEPEVLLLDEPTASLDHTTVNAVECLVERWHAERSEERSLVWVSHDLDQARRMRCRILMMESGCVQPGQPNAT